MAGEGAYAHLLPGFPEETRFVRLETKKISAKGAIEKQPIISMAADKISAHEGDIFLFIAKSEKPKTAAVLKKFNLRMAKKPCINIQDPLFTSKIKKIHKDYVLCSLKKINT